LLGLRATVIWVVLICFENSRFLQVVDEVFGGELLLARVVGGLTTIVD
jgi:hypothetical protein